MWKCKWVKFWVHKKFSLNKGRICFHAFTTMLVLSVTGKWKYAHSLTILSCQVAITKMAKTIKGSDEEKKNVPRY